MSSISITDLHIHYDSNPTLRGVSLDIEDGEFFFLLGPSGCGKSTTLRMIAGLEEVSKGDLLIGERRVNDVLPRDRNIAMVFQSYALYPHMSVRDNMAFGLKLRKTPQKEIDKRVMEASGLLGLDEYLDRKPKALSGGQRQRVAMGRAIVRRPEVFLFDEPLSNLDAKLRGEMRREIAKLHQRLKTTIVYVTHDQDEALSLATNIALMNRGTFVQTGSPRALYHHPSTLFAATFMGAANTYSGVVAATEHDTGLVTVKSDVGTVVGSTAGDALLEEGAPVTILIRPEAVRMDPTGSIEGQIRNRYFMGPISETVVEVGDELVKVTAMEREDSTDPAPSVRLTFPPDSLFVFPSEATP